MVFERLDFLYTPSSDVAADARFHVDVLGGRLVFADLAAARAQLSARGWDLERSLEISQGPLSSYRTPGGHRFALYQETRPGVLNHFEGRRDF